METSAIQTEKDRLLWKIAKKRVGFKNHLASYFIVNTMLWAIWFLTGQETENGDPWPLYCTLWWGFGLFWHFMGMFIFDNRISQIEKEFQKLKERTAGGKQA